MNLKNILQLCLCVLLLSACRPQAVRLTDRGAVVTLPQSSPTDVRMVRLEVMGEKLIRVTATPADAFAERASLIVVPQMQSAPYTVDYDDSLLHVKTDSLIATVSLHTGAVSFADAQGHPIVSEAPDGRTFEPFTADGKTAYSVRQVFLSAGDDEAYYGLGQHQADEFNYKGKNEELFQYNTKVSVPFVVSNRGYGILWDSYSMLRFGDPRAYAQLGEVFRLYDAYGQAGALTGIYTPAKDPEQGKIVRREDSLYFEHLLRVPGRPSENLSRVVNLPEGFPFMGSNVTYEGELEAKESGLHRFILYYAGYMTVYIDGRKVVPERWRTAWNPNSYKFAVDLEAGRRVPIRIEWKPDGYVSYCGLRVLSPVDETQQKNMSWWGEMQEDIDYYFVYGRTPDEVVSGYRTLTGKAPIMPKWAMGYWQSRERYKTQAELLGNLREFRRRRIPIDNIVLDWSYWPQSAWGSHEFDAVRFPDPQSMVDSVHAMHGHMMISVWPKFYEGIEHFKEFDDQGWMYRRAVADSIRDWIGSGYVGSFYDAYDPDARKAFWRQMCEHLFVLGIDAWWMDASEPNVRDCTDMDYRKELCGPTALGPSAEYFNAYALMNAEAIYDGQRGEDPDKRVFLLTRSGFAGLQRYSTATWSGDIATRWEDMKAQISAGLNFAVSGIPYWTMDIGGFCVESRYEKGQKEYDKTGRENEDYKEWRELNVRWYQFGAFCPLFRAHGQYPYREVWNIAPEGHPCYNSIVYYLKLRYRLMPYIYSLAGATYFDDYTMMRPLFMDFTTDARVRDIADQYMFGPALMVAPVYAYGARQREVCFPAATGWYDFYTDRYVAGGGAHMVDAPYEHIPLYVRAGAILPMGRDMQYSDECAADSLTLCVYAGADGRFTLYEDEGSRYDYEQGRYAMIPITYTEATGQLVIGERRGEYDGMLRRRTFHIVRIGREGRQHLATVVYDGSVQTLQL